MTYDDQDNSWLDAVVQESAVPRTTRTANRDLRVQKWTWRPEVCQKISRALKGTQKTAETRAKMSRARKGHEVTAEHRAKLAAARRGKTNSADHRAKLRASRCKTIVLPTGQFESRAAAVDWLTRQGVRNALKKVAKWLRTHPDQVYYLPKDTA